MTPEEIVKRLRDFSADTGDMEDAADLIERQSKALEEAEKALEPFAVIKGNYSAQSDNMSLGCGFGVYGDVRFHFHVGDMRRAETALANIRAAKGGKNDA